MASDKITLWGRGSGRTMRAHWMLREFGLEYDIKPIQSRTGETQTAEYTAINPKQKIPLLQHGNFVLNSVLFFVKSVLQFRPNFALNVQPNLVLPKRWWSEALTRKALPSPDRNS